MSSAVGNWWLSVQSQPAEKSRTLRKLASALEHNHGDRWLADFLEAPLAARANQLLDSAIKANHDGNQETAIRKAEKALSEYRHVKNQAGVRLSQLQIIYALRRQSKAKECLTRTAFFEPSGPIPKYDWVDIQLKIETSICAGMAKNFDQAWRIATETVQEAQTAKYSALHLRCMALESALQSSEGRAREAWQLDEEGLRLFWTYTFPPERGFQFYSDMELVAEQNGSWHLAMALQKEALSLIEQTGRLDFEALAYVRLATTMAMAHEPGNAQNKFQRAYALFRSMGSSDTTKFYQASLEIGLSQIELRQGSTEVARQRLNKVRSTLDKVSNFAVQLQYQKAWAELERQLGDRREEAHHLEKAVEIGDRGFATLRSVQDRWSWQQEVGDAYRRLLDLGFSERRAPEQDLADWEAYRARSTLYIAPSSAPAIGNQPALHTLNRQTKALRDSTLLTFAVFEDRVIAWVADDRGVQEFQISMDSKILAREIRKFYVLCSDPLSPIEKVKATGSRLYKWLVAPIRGALDPNRVLFIAADEVMSSIVWPAFSTPNGNYFGQSFTIVNTSGLAYDQQTSKASAWTGRVVIARPGSVTLNGRYLPLPDAGREVDYVTHLFPNNRVLVDWDVTSLKLIKQLSDAQIFHFAGHAISREYGGELIIEKKDGSGDVLSASTVANLILKQTKLVVLSACSTGAGLTDISRDPNGLIWAFLNAGAEQVVASRWDVDSGATSDFMQNFYRVLRRSETATTAMTTAQQSLILSPSKSHPYYWAAFQVFGKTNSLQRRDHAQRKANKFEYHPSRPLVLRTR